MTRTDFFEALKDNCSTEKEYLIRLIKLRGFLLVEKDNRLYMSDNSHSDDPKYLDSLLRKYEIGSVNGNEIVIIDNPDATLFEGEFQENTSIPMEVVTMDTDWRWFKYRIHGEKAPVEVLEPFIARYVKAISAACVLTVGCCDGNHRDRNKIYLQLSGCGSVTWHRLICEHFLKDKYDLQWMNDYTAISITPDTKYNTYYQLNMAAHEIYDNRMLLRRIKTKALEGMSNSYLKRMNENIEKEFVGNVIELFEKL